MWPGYLAPRVLVPDSKIHHTARDDARARAFWNCTSSVSSDTLLPMACPRASFEQGGGGGEGVLDPKRGVPKMA